MGDQYTYSAVSSNVERPSSSQRFSKYKEGNHYIWNLKQCPFLGASTIGGSIYCTYMQILWDRQLHILVGQFVVVRFDAANVVWIFGQKILHKLSYRVSKLISSSVRSLLGLLVRVTCKHEPNVRPIR